MADTPAIIPLGKDLPSYIDLDKAKRGFENVGDLLKPPLLYQIQGQSRVKEDPSWEGHFWSEGHNIMIPCPFYVVPVKYELEFMMFDDDRNIMWRTHNVDDPNVRELGNDSWRARWHHVLVKAPWAHKDHLPLTSMWSFKGTGEKIVRRWISEMAQRPGDMFSQVYKIDRPKKPASNNRGSWWYPEITFEGFVDPKSFERINAEYQNTWAAHHVSGAKDTSDDDAPDPAPKAASEDVPF